MMTDLSFLGKLFFYWMNQWINQWEEKQTNSWGLTSCLMVESLEESMHNRLQAWHVEKKLKSYSEQERERDRERFCHWWHSESGHRVLCWQQVLEPRASTTFAFLMRTHSSHTAKTYIKTSHGSFECRIMGRLTYRMCIKLVCLALRPKKLIIESATQTIRWKMNTI